MGESSAILAKKTSSYRPSCNLSDARYEVIREQAKGLGWRLLRGAGTVDIVWRDLWMEPGMFKFYKMYQKVNHFPAMAELARKTNLGRNLKRMKKLFPVEYDMFPMTYILPAEYDLLMSQSLKKPKQFYIVKPECGSQGRGIYLTTTPGEKEKENRCFITIYGHLTLDSTPSRREGEGESMRSAALLESPSTHRWLQIRLEALRLDHLRRAAECSHLQGRAGAVLYGGVQAPDRHQYVTLTPLGPRFLMRCTRFWRASVLIHAALSLAANPCSCT